MRNALIGLFLAATAMTPATAPAQEVDGERQRVMERYERLERHNQERHERREQRAAPAPQAVQRQQHVRRDHDEQSGRVERRSDTDRVWQGDRGDPRLEAHRRRYEALERRNRVRYGTEEQRREVRDHGRDGRRSSRGDHQDRHRDYREEHRDLHRDNPVRREHRDFHRDVNRDHGRYHRSWDRNWRSDRRYDWRSFRGFNRGLYVLPPYYAPFRGHRYSRFGIGAQLGSPFYQQRYWISDPWQYRLPAAPAGYRWVRYYDDVLLVDTWTGEVVDVIYDFFW